MDRDAFFTRLTSMRAEALRRAERLAALQHEKQVAEAEAAAARANKEDAEWRYRLAIHNQVEHQLQQRSFDNRARVLDAESAVLTDAYDQLAQAGFECDREHRDADAIRVSGALAFITVSPCADVINDATSLHHLLAPSARSTSERDLRVLELWLRVPENQQFMEAAQRAVTTAIRATNDVRGRMQQPPLAVPDVLQVLRQDVATGAVLHTTV
jgi:hypothetical protein